MLTPEQVLFDRERVRIGRLQDEDGSSYIRKVGKHALNGDGLAVVDFLTLLMEQPHPNLLVPINFSGSAGEVLIEDYPDLSKQGKLDATGHEVRGELARGRIGVSAIVDFMVQISDGVDFIHRNGYAHLDVRAPNVFVKRESGRFVPTLFDYNRVSKPFFLEHAVTAAIREIPLEERVGQVMIDGRHDVYQLGWMLRELTHYQASYEAGLETWRPATSLDDDLAEVIGYATGPFDSRYPDAGELRDALLATGEG
jgi:serine/threonine protein kinase